MWKKMRVEEILELRWKEWPFLRGHVKKTVWRKGWMQTQIGLWSEGRRFPYLGLLE